MRLRVKQKGFRTKTIVVATTLLQPRQASRQQLTDLYRKRWYGDVDWRSLKETMQMSILRGKSPAMVRKELWAHFLAYNLIRTVMAQTAQEYKVLPRELGFKGTLQTLVALAPHVMAVPEGDLPALAAQIRAAIIQHRVGDRPDHYEPRARKRRYDNYQHLHIPRAEAKTRLRKGTYE